MLSDASTSAGTSLILRLQDSDPDAWHQLVDLYAPLIFFWCQDCGLDSSDSADVMQEVFLAASKSIVRFQPQPDGTLRGWLWTITQNKIRDFARRRQKQIQATGGTQAHLRIAELPMHEEAAEPTSQLQTSRLLDRALDQIENDFASNTWQAFWLTAIEGHDTSSVAEQLGMSVNGVRQAKSRVLRRLREQLGER